MDDNNIKLFENKRIRAEWDEEKQEYFFSIVDVCGVLTDSDYQTARNYWKWLKTKLKDEGSELVSHTNQLKMKAHDGKMRPTKALTDEWDNAGVKQGAQYAALTDLMTKTWSGMNIREYKKHKDLKKENLRDNMTNTELVLNMLAEVATTDISIERQPFGFNESAQVAKEGAKAARVARKQIEKSTGKSAVSALNAKNLGQRKAAGNSNLSELPTGSSPEDSGGDSDDEA